MPLNYTAEKRDHCIYNEKYRGYIYLLYEYKNRNQTGEYQSLLCTNNSEKTIENMKIKYPPHEWIKCGVDLNYGNKITLYGENYPFDGLPLIITFFTISFLALILYITFSLFYCEKVKDTKEISLLIENDNPFETENVIEDNFL